MGFPNYCGLDPRRQLSVRLIRVVFIVEVFAGLFHSLFVSLLLREKLLGDLGVQRTVVKQIVLAASNLVTGLLQMRVALEVVVWLYVGNPLC